MTDESLAQLPPRPERLTPVVVYASHEVRPEQDVDQTFHPNWHTEQRRREERNIELKRMLLAGTTVAYRSSGRSLEPRVMDGSRCTYVPVTSVDQVLTNDIVFCELQDGDRFYVGLVKSKALHHLDGCFYFFISNLKGVDFWQSLWYDEDDGCCYFTASTDGVDAACSSTSNTAS